MTHPLPRLEIVPPRPLREEVYRKLRQAILDDAYPPGTKLVESELAAHLSISRTPIREALHKLELEGLVERGPGASGLRVAGLTPEEVREIYGIRAVLEGYAARLAADRAAPADVRRLEALLEASEAAIAAHDRPRLLQLNTEFHDAINALSGSRRLTALLLGLREQIVKYRRATLEIGGQGAIALAEHRAIVEALAAGDGERAERLVLAHVERKMRDVSAHLSGAS